MSAYSPGNCNIGRDEIRKRYGLGFGGLAATGALVYAVTYLSLPAWSVLGSFVPMLFAAEGLYQGYFRFCVGFAAGRVFDFSGTSSEKGRVADAEAHRLDMRKAMMVNLLSVLTAAAVASALYALAAALP